MGYPLHCSECGGVIAEWVASPQPKDLPPRLRWSGAMVFSPGAGPTDPDRAALAPQGDVERKPMVGGEMDLTYSRLVDRLLDIKCLAGHTTTVLRRDVARVWDMMLRGLVDR